MSDEECARLLASLKHPDRAQCLSDGNKITLILNLDRLKIDQAFEILDDVKSKVKHTAKPVRVLPFGVFEDV